MAAQQPQMTQQQYNAAARNAILATALDEWQNIAGATLTSNILGAVINVPVRNVGLIKRFVVEVAAQVQTTNGITQNLTVLGSSNIFSQVVLTDLSNQTRINTTGWHLTAIASAKAKMPFGSAITATDTPFGYGNNYKNTQTAPLAVSAPSSANNVFAMFEVPLAYSDTDLRGAIYANVVNATMTLQLTVNPAFFALLGADATSSVYQSSSATVPGTLVSLTYNIYQNYLDQLPINPNGKGTILPILDLSTAYTINNTAFSGLVQNQDFPIPYANFRDFLSTTIVYDNGGTLNAGTDIAYFALQSANYTNIFKVDPNIVSLWMRLRIQSDAPRGMYYFDHRKKPVSTIQYGNMQLIVNPSNVANASSNFLVGWESLALINNITQAGSLAAN